MARTHEVPNHLNVEDTLFLGLTARQLAVFMAFASPAYGVWDQLTVLPEPIRGALAVAVASLGVLFALFQPGNRPLDEWAFVLFAYVFSARRLSWRRVEPDLHEWRAAAATGWADLAPNVGWASMALERRRLMPSASLQAQLDLTSIRTSVACFGSGPRAEFCGVLEVAGLAAVVVERLTTRSKKSCWPLTRSS